MNCPNCNSEDVKKNGVRKGRQMYKCCSCKAYFTEGIPYKKKNKYPTIVETFCPDCGSYKVHRDKKENGVQYFKCETCGYYFNTTTPLTEIEDMVAKEKSIIEAVMIGKNVGKIAEEYNSTPQYINNLLKPYYATETITPEQKKDIIKFGFYLNVPVDYMAEYVKCSEHKCEEVLTKFRKKLMSTTRDAI